MAKSKSKFNGILKGVAVGFAFVLCSAFFPFNAAVSLAETLVGGDATSGTQRIEIGENENEQAYSSTVVKGDTYTIPQGSYYNGDSEHIIGTTISGNINVSKVEVLYEATSDVVVEEISGLASWTSQTFVADRIGTYTIRYTVVDNGTEYSYDYDVVCTASDATFEFKANDENIVPTVYDKSIAENKNVTIPLPTVTDEDGEVLLSSDDYTNETNYYTNDMSNIPTYVPGEINAFVYISLTGGSESTDDGTSNVQLLKDEETGEYYISGDAISNEIAGTQLRITYSYYELRSNSETPVFIASTSTEFTVQDEYYFTSSRENEHGYSLSTSWSTTRPTSAVVGIAVDLPSITATTRSTNSPASESVNVYYNLQIMKYNETTGRYDLDVTEETYDSIENTFTAKEEGSYRFIYTVYDFYGNTVDTSSTSFTINNVSDTQQANVHVYDAGTYSEEDGDNYIDASYKLKTEGLNRNLIIYAIAGTDNMVDSSEIELRREIRDASTVRFVVDEPKYNGYNLIFAPSTMAGEGEVNVIDYVQIASDNFDIYRQMLADPTNNDPSDADSVKAWLLEHNYLIVTTYWNQTTNGGEAILDAEDDGYSETVGDQEAISAMIEKGFAYVEARNSSGHLDELDPATYTVYYYADDNTSNNSERAVYYNMVLSETFSDSGVPTINFSTDLQTTVLPNETITFDVATATDSIDSSLDVVTAYRFVDESGQPIEDEEATGTLQFVVKADGNNVNMNYDAESNKWFITEADENGLVTSDGWYVDLTETEYSVNLATAPNEAFGVEIFAYAVDDAGNISFYDRTISIAKAQDSDVPGLIRVENAPDGEQTYTAPQTIALPTLEFSDSRVDYMYAVVEVYQINDVDEHGNVLSKTLLQSRNVTTSIDTYRGVFRVNGGTFNASVSGTYQVLITVVDGGNHTVSTYFTYDVEDSGKIEDPQISNISSQGVEAAAGVPFTLDPPVLTIPESDTFGYIGINMDDDSNVSTYYTTSIVSSNGEYHLTQNSFTGLDKGKYELEYTVFLMRYRVDDLLGTSGTDSAEAGIFLDEEGRLKYKEAGTSGEATEYFIYFQATENGYVATMNTEINGTGTAPSVEEEETLEEVVKSLLDGKVDMFALPSLPKTITVDDIGVNILFDGNPYEQTSYPNLDENRTVTIVKPDIDIQGNAYVNEAESYIQITCTSSSERNVGTIYFDKWEESIENDDSDFVVEDGVIKLKLNRNGEYTITYYVVAMDRNGDNIGEARTMEFSISNGDVQDPEVVIDEDMFNSTYKLGDTLVIDIDAIDVSDNITTDDPSADRTELLDTMRITITNNDTNTTDTIDNSAGEDGYEYEYELTEVGNYTVTITVTDKAGRTGSDSFSFEVTSDGGDPINVQEVLGGVLIGLSVVVLAGVVVYFVVSKVKLDKRAKGYERDIKNDKNKK